MRQPYEQEEAQGIGLQRPTSDDQESWKMYWERQGQLWCMEPEIDVERQNYLAERCAMTPDVKLGIYPFKDIKLSRADVEWLLATHENGRGPIDYSDESQRNIASLACEAYEQQTNKTERTNIHQNNCADSTIRI